MPGKHRISAEQAMLFINNIRECLTLVGLTPDEYAPTLESNAKRGIIGGAIYDALLAECAIKARAEKIFTWNTRHYEQFRPDIARLVQRPK
jgi:predicted nucleic acid-binding protein